MLALGLLTPLGWAPPGAAAQGGGAETAPQVRAWAGAPALTTFSRGSVGSTGGGDPYFPLDGNGGYQVDHYRIVDTYDPATDQLTGRTILTATATHRLTAFHLDLALTPDAVKVDAVAAAHSKPMRHELRVQPARPIAAGERFEVKVTYHGRPASTRAAGLQPFLFEEGEGVALGEPQIGPWWFAANETPTDKATYDITVRVPRGKQAVSNGELVSRTPDGDWTAWRWRMSDPMLTYLAFFAAGDFAIEQTVADGRPAVYAVSERLSADAVDRSFELLHRTPGVVSWLEDQFGPYPFGQTGGVVTSLFSGFALENQSRPVYPFVGGPTAGNVSLVVHEQAHQWFGDDVALRRWRDTWLNEGFATYAEWLYAEDHGGMTVDQQLRATYAAWAAGSPFWALQVSDPGADSIWEPPVYDRGAMTLAALRNVLGDADMAALLRQWVADHHEGHGTRAQFQALAQSMTATDLTVFFREWLDDTDKPPANVSTGLAAG